MVFKNPFKSKSNNQVKSYSVPEIFGTGTFYSLKETSQNSLALIKMYNELPEIQAPINYIIDSLTNIPYKHYKAKGDNITEVINSDVIKLLKNPNDFQTENDFIKLFFINRIVLGIGYINTIAPIGFSSPAELFILPSDKTKPILNSKENKDFRTNFITGYETSFSHEPVKIDKENVFVQREASIGQESFFNTRSRLMSAILTSDSLRYNYEARIKMLSDRGAVGLLTPKGDLNVISAEDAQEMREAFYKKNGITGNKFPFHIGGIPMDYTATSMNASELKLNENKLQDFQTICSVLGVDSSLFENSRATYNNKILAKKNFTEDVIIPYFNNYLQLQERVNNLPEDEFLKADYSEMPSLQEDYEKKVNANSKAYNDGAISEIEYREAIGFEGGSDERKNTGTQSDNTEQ